MSDFSRAISLVLLAATCFACATQQPPISRHAKFAREADPEMVKGCELIGTVYGGEAMGVTIFSGQASTDAAIRKMLANATEKGATHVVVGDADTNLRGGASVTGRAYKCEPEASD